MNKLRFFTLLILVIFTNALTAQVKTLSIKTSVATDDVTEIKETGVVATLNTSLALTNNFQFVGIRFTGVNLPANAIITKACIQFSANMGNAATGTVNISVQQGNAAAFTTAAFNLSSRPFNLSVVNWTPQPWTTYNERTTKQRTSDLSGLVKQAMESGWVNGGALAFKLTSSVLGYLDAASTSMIATANPELIIEYIDQPTPRVALSNVFLNEAAGSGSSTVSNDWVELFNNNTTTINLDSVFVTDNKSKPEKFMFKNAVILQKGYLRLELDNDLTVSTPNKAAFSISSTGETVYLFQKLNGILSLIDSLNVPPSIYNTSLARVPDASTNLVVVNTPTPSVSNNTAKTSLDLQFSQPRGLYAAGFALTLTAPAGATIRYTINSTIPSATVGTVYTAPIQITANTVVKAVATSATGLSKVITHTYIITTNPAYKELPIIVLSTTSPTNLNPLLNTNAEAVSTCEYINKYGEGLSSFADAGFKTFGAGTGLLPKKNFRFHFRSQYGYSKFRHPIFEKRAEENYAPVEEFNSLDLKTGEDGTGDFGLGGTMLSEITAHNYMRQMGDTGVHVRFAHLFLNGSYNGVYALREHFSTSYMESYYGGNKTDYDNIDGTNAIEAWNTAPVVSDGNKTQLTDLQQYATTNFQEIKKRLNTKQFIDFMMLFFIGDYEWEFRTSADHGYDQSKWIFHHNDFDGFIRPAATGIGNYQAKLTVKGAKGPYNLFTLAGFGGSNLEYKTLVKDRTLILFNENDPINGVFSVNNMKAKTEQSRDQFRKVNSLEYGRWTGVTAAQFEQRVAAYIAYLPTRVQTVKNFLNTNGLIHTLAPLSMNKPAGKIAATDQVIITNPNANTTVYYTLDGQDVVFDNAVATWAKSYTTGQALPLKEGKNTLKARPYTNGNFGPLTEITYIVAPAVNITGVNYFPKAASAKAADSLEFLLVTNYGTAVRAVGGDSITTAIDFVFPAGTTLNAGETVMIAKFPAKYPTVTLRKFSWTSGKLADAGEKVIYKTAAGEIINEFTYLPTAPWATTPAGQGFYLKLNTPNLDNAVATNWSAASLTTVSTLALVGSKIDIFAQKQGSKAIISWTSPTKEADDVFNIEKLNNETGKFEVVKTQRGTDNQAGYFQYTDEDPSVLADNLYRIALYRGNGVTPQYSAVVRLDFSYMLNYSVYPNPANDFVTIEIHKTQVDNATLRIVNIYGQTVVEQVVSTKNGIVNLSTEALGAGQYILFMDIKGKRSVAKKLTIVR